MALLAIEDGCSVRQTVLYGLGVGVANDHLETFGEGDDRGRIVLQSQPTNSMGLGYAE
jgi:hypothetical protein